MAMLNAAYLSLKTRFKENFEKITPTPKCNNSNQHGTNAQASSDIALENDARSIFQMKRIQFGTLCSISVLFLPSLALKTMSSLPYWISRQVSFRSLTCWSRAWPYGPSQKLLSMFKLPTDTKNAVFMSVSEIDGITWHNWVRCRISLTNLFQFYGTTWPWQLRKFELIFVNLTSRLANQTVK